MFDVLLYRTSKYVIPRRGKAPTWESPGTMFVPACIFDGTYQEIATSRRALLAMTWKFGGWLRRFKQIDKLKFASQERTGWAQWRIDDHRPTRLELSAGTARSNKNKYIDNYLTNTVFEFIMKVMGIFARICQSI